ncbi:MAG: hypothetical protein GY798_24650 [Hyphomicrobiales bacterium]|nr:hypothetical protein [Hyphomicrobiales bacterium]
MRDAEANIVADKSLARVQALKRVGAGLSITIFPILLLVGFVTHPNIFGFEMITDVETWSAEWRGNFLFHFGHLLVLFAVPFIIVAGFRFMSMLTGRGVWYGFVGGILGVFGAFMLAVDKGALTLVLTAFQRLPDDQFASITPALQALLDRGGWLWMTWLFVTLPLGFVLLAVGLVRERIIPTWQGVTIIVGLLLLKESIAAAGPVMISALDTFRDTLEDLGGDRGVTDALSGEAVVEGLG